MEANQNPTRPVLLNDGERLYRIEVDDIAYLEAERTYCNMYMKDGSKYLLSRPLGDVEKELPCHIFVRVHRSYVINIWMVKQIMGSCITLTTGKAITASKKHAVSLASHFIVLCQPRSEVEKHHWEDRL